MLPRPPEARVASEGEGQLCITRLILACCLESRARQQQCMYMCVHMRAYMCVYPDGALEVLRDIIIGQGKTVLDWSSCSSKTLFSMAVVSLGTKDSGGPRIPNP